MKSRKLLALFLAIFMLASLIVPASAETITPETNVTNGVVGYDAALVDKLTTEEMAAIPSISTYAADFTAKTVKTAYKIESAADWQTFDDLVKSTAVDEVVNAEKNQIAHKAFSGVTIYLAKDIDFNGDVITPIGASAEVTRDKETGKYTVTGDFGWYPYGFAGVFDGQGYAIKNVTIRPETKAQVNNQFFGVFTNLTDLGDVPCKVKNFVIDSTVVLDAFTSIDGTALSYKHDNWQGAHVAGLAGSACGFRAENVATVVIENVCNKAPINFDSRDAAGIINMVKICDLTMINVTNEGDLTQKTYLRGYNNKAAIGGLIGRFGESDKDAQVSGVITNCRNAGDITVHAVNSTVGGIVGGAFQKSVARTLTITNCINNGNITGSRYTVEGEVADDQLSHASQKWWHVYGGVFGWSDGNFTINMNGCKNYGTISSTIGQSGGGMYQIAHQWNKTNCVEAAGSMDPTYNMVAKYYQMSNKTYKNTEDADCYSIRLVALHNGDLALLDSYAYDITIQYGDTTVQASTGALTSVRTEIAVDSKLGEGVTKISASALGADYVSAVRIDNIPTSIDKITVTIVPTMTKGETTTTAAPITFTVDPAVYNAQ